MEKQKIIIVDDEEGMLDVCQETLEELDNVEVETYQSSLDAVERLKTDSVDLLVTDINMPGLNGVDLLRTACQLDPNVQVLLMTGFPSVDTAVQALRLGASDYLTKPFHPDELLEIARRLLRDLRLRLEHKLLARHLGRDYMFGEMVGVCSKMLTIFGLIDQVASSDAPVLVTGETGTGKELVARAIHKRSPQAKSRFVPVDCGAMPESLMESEFFGHEKGSFTGANERTIGLLEYADRGTLFLDEVAELPLQLQAKLLRALQEGSFRRVGGKAEIGVKIRVLAASNRNLEAMVEAGDFREDLYYRLNVVNLHLPPLRERDGDIPLLVSHFLSCMASDSRRRVLEMEKDALEVLLHHSWPGNVRQLQNVLKRAVALVKSETITLGDLPEAIVLGSLSSPSSPTGFFQERSKCIEVFESKYLHELLQFCAGNVAQAAQRAGLPRGTLYRLFRRNGLDPKDFRN
ncbi:MAG: sigma-54-dependent Fis family transcriptional regulator [Planctomycetes bacterium]|nr:sigma-54-dependent Fis family transcriptional regulator [Planctomycetota bacterium]